MSDQKVGVQPPPPPYGYQAQPSVAYQPQQPGYQPQPIYLTPGYQPVPYQQSSANVIVVQQPQSVGRTAHPGACRHCGLGVPHTEFTLMGILIAIVIFPIGIICCFMLQETRCTSCHAKLA